LTDYPARQSPVRQFATSQPVQALRGWITAILTGEVAIRPSSTVPLTYEIAVVPERI
jgi:hypothetical protein